MESSNLSKNIFDSISLLDHDQLNNKKKTKSKNHTTIPIFENDELYNQLDDLKNEKKMLNQKINNLNFINLFNEKILFDIKKELKTLTKFIHDVEKNYNKIINHNNKSLIVLNKQNKYKNFIIFILILIVISLICYIVLSFYHFI